MAKFSGNIRSYHIWIGLNITGIIIALVALYVCYFHFDYFHYQLCNVYASLGHADAQHIMGERLLHGKGVEKDQVNAVIFKMEFQELQTNSNYWNVSTIFNFVAFHTKFLLLK